MKESKNKKPPADSIEFAAIPLDREFHCKVWTCDLPSDLKKRLYRLEELSRNGRGKRGRFVREKHQLPLSTLEPELRKGNPDIIGLRSLSWNSDSNNWVISLRPIDTKALTRDLRNWIRKFYLDETILEHPRHNDHNAKDYANLVIERISPDIFSVPKPADIRLITGNGRIASRYTFDILPVFAKKQCRDLPVDFSVQTSPTEAKAYLSVRPNIELSPEELNTVFHEVRTTLSNKLSRKDESVLTLRSLGTGDKKSADIELSEIHTTGYQQYENHILVMQFPYVVSADPATNRKYIETSVLYSSRYGYSARQEKKFRTSLEKFPMEFQSFLEKIGPNMRVMADPAFLEDYLQRPSDKRCRHVILIEDDSKTRQFLNGITDVAISTATDSFGEINELSLDREKNHLICTTPDRSTEIFRVRTSESGRIPAVFPKEGETIEKGLYRSRPGKTYSVIPQENGTISTWELLPYFQLSPEFLSVREREQQQELLSTLQSFRETGILPLDRTETILPPPEALPDVRENSRHEATMTDWNFPDLKIREGGPLLPDLGKIMATGIYLETTQEFQDFAGKSHLPNNVPQEMYREIIADFTSGQHTADYLLEKKSRGDYAPEKMSEKVIGNMEKKKSTRF